MSDGSTGTPHPGPSTGEPRPRPRPWAPRPPALPDGWFRLTNAASRMCLTVPDAAVNAAQGLVQATCANGTEQLWRLTEEEPGLYSVRNANSALCLSVDAARKENGVVITQYLCGDEEHPLFPDQVWGFRWDATYRAWRLVNRHSGKCVTVRPGGGDREQVLQWDCGDESWRLWRT
ncbi:RICIN domain-containing protein [Streptomyces pactum]|uniref:RICIN domain-containing protein n=1 Tax=Streptomyces pactum TaxID=68249 RepID=UPI0022B5C420|nr:RICIN domain-containing protein [Streptomyces pactum]